jgi:hypothetical protein
MIVLAPNIDRGADGPLFTAVLENDGTFAVAPIDGKPMRPGWYRISIAPRAGTVGVPSPLHPHPGLPRRFRDPSLSGLEHEVKAGVENLICFDLED